MAKGPYMRAFTITNIQRHNTVRRHGAPNPGLPDEQRATHIRAF